MSIRTRTSAEIGPLRNKVSINLSDEELETLDEIRQKENESQAAQGRTFMLEGFAKRGFHVTAHGPKVRHIGSKRR